MANGKQLDLFEQPAAEKSVSPVYIGGIPVGAQTTSPFDGSIITSPKSCFDDGFELLDINLEPNCYNVGGIQCKTCPIVTTCILKAKGYSDLCFEGLHKQLVETNVCEKVKTKQPLSDTERNFHLYVDSMIYHLDKLPNPTTHPMDLAYRMDLITDFALPSLMHNPKLAAICRMFGFQTVYILKQRGY